MNTTNLNNEACLVISKKDILYSVLLVAVIAYIGYAIYDKSETKKEMQVMKSQIFTAQQQSGMKINAVQRINKLQAENDKEVKLNGEQNKILSEQNKVLEDQAKSIKHLYEINTRLTDVLENKIINHEDKQVSIEETNPLLKKDK